MQQFVEFQFFPVNHSVVRAEYLFPCIPYEMTGFGKKGFFSGFHPVDAFLHDVSSDPPQVDRCRISGRMVRDILTSIVLHGWSQSCLINCFFGERKLQNPVEDTKHTPAPTGEASHERSDQTNSRRNGQSYVLRLLCSISRRYCILC